MKNYDDLQRFQEKTQTLDIAFKDMSGQSLEADHSQWAIIRQLATDDEPELGSGQRVDLPQPQPIRGDEFVAPPQALNPAPVARSEKASLLQSLAASAPAPDTETPRSALFPPASSAPTAASVSSLAPAATHVARQAATSLFPPPPISAPVAEQAVAPAAAAPATTPAVAQPEPATPSRFGALFRSRAAEPVHLSKETLLKPLLEKIALCH
ncbi:cellulose biosynthesis protein BcsO [Pantoea dispersa]|uniref:Cellulose biosynthesis protein BcsO n=1 Tax=Pantoea dispersa TaxID=59814 RepID=A0ABY2ZSF6_9GAMM|nr:cellulose biosynthesis protein BcsO [Pantoea dispersa]TQC64312.1 cellulose biosynthesis protein BcsO [Pantoea dispersa]